MSSEFFVQFNQFTHPTRKWQLLQPTTVVSNNELYTSVFRLHEFLIFGSNECYIHSVLCSFQVLTVKQFS